MGEEADAGHQEEHLASGSDVFLGELEGRKRLSRAAGHDELSAVVVAESGHDLVDRDPLVVARLLLVRKREVLGSVEAKARPVDAGGLEVGEPDAAYRDRLALDRVLGVGVPLVAGRDDDPLAELRLARGSEE